MAESINYRKNKTGNIPFYGAVKSSNEVYYQMASLFQEATRGEKKLARKWMDHILKSHGVIIPG